MNARIVVGLSEYRALHHAGTLVTLGLGSCVAIALHDPTTGTGGLAHILLPGAVAPAGVDQPGRYPATAVPALLAAMQGLGANPAAVTGRLVGGASMFANITARGSVSIGDRNVLAAREALRAHRIPLAGELVGGDWGRSVAFDVATGVIEVTSVRYGPQLL